MRWSSSFHGCHRCSTDAATAAVGDGHPPGAGRRPVYPRRRCQARRVAGLCSGLERVPPCHHPRVPAGVWSVGRGGSHLSPPRHGATILPPWLGTASLVALAPPNIIACAPCARVWFRDCRSRTATTYGVGVSFNRPIRGGVNCRLAHPALPPLCQASGCVDLCLWTHAPSSGRCPSGHTHSPPLHPSPVPPPPGWRCYPPGPPSAATTMRA